MNTAIYFLCVPWVIPVTAGKKTPVTTKKETSDVNFGEKFSANTEPEYPVYPSKRHDFL